MAVVRPALAERAGESRGHPVAAGHSVSRVEAIHTLYWGLLDDSTWVDSRGRGHVARLFFMKADWRAIEDAATWLRRNVPPDSRVITVMPHWIYLRTGLQAVQPPYVADAIAVQDLVDLYPRITRSSARSETMRAT